MVTDSIDQELNTHDRDRVKEADRIWQRMAKEGGHFEDWKAVGEVLMVGRHYTMRALGIQRPGGKRYNELFGQWRKRHFPEMSPVTCSNLLLLAEPETSMVVDELRRAMTDTERMQVTHPDTMAKRVRRHLRGQSSPTKTEKRNSLLEKLKAENVELKRRLANGFLLDFHTDSVEKIATELVGTNRKRAKQLCEALKLEVQRTAMKPASPR